MTVFLYELTVHHNSPREEMSRRPGFSVPHGGFYSPGFSETNSGGLDSQFLTVVFTVRSFLRLIPLHEQMSDDIPVDQNRLPLHPLSDAETSNQQVVTPPPNSGSIPWTGSDQWDVLNEQNSFSSLPIDTDSESTRVCRKYGVHRWPPRDLKKEEVFPLALSNVEDIGQLDSPEDLEVDVRTEPTDHSCPSSSHLENESIITFESLRQHFGRRRVDVAKSLGDSICRQHGITRWPNLQISVLGPLQNEGRAMGPPDPSQPSMDADGRSFICAERSNLDVACSEESNIIPRKRKRGKTGVKIEHQDGISQLTSAMPSNQASLLEEGILQLTFDRPSNQVLESVAHVKPRDTAVQDTKTVTIRAKYENGFTIKFKLPLWSGLEELHQQVGKRLNLKAEGYDIMYEDEDGEPILIACDEDLQLCINTSRSSGKNSIVVLLGPKKLL
ncbi:hypothetical protein Vadar_028862 [Vaccinium darrowii]|uniref:Uncharacterized protein n=1 Tax=Vaccinium darrowii TaxID=229202 RepID=A0ACB7XKK4_9ERIC|nr:hypothetical protein Vadar_028862 [Vaccinium darrowii]